MLETLRSIILEVNEARDLTGSLEIIVRRVQKSMDVKVCSVYLLDHNLGRYVLMATKGLDQVSVGKASLAPEEGLVGLVAQRAEPVNLEHASSHPRYFYIPETREEEFESFLGVPVIHHREVLGVLVVQQSEVRAFDAEEEAFLITLSAQLAGIIANEEARGAITGFSPTGLKTNDAVFEGVPGAPGVVIAEAVTVFPPADLGAIPSRKVDDIDGTRVLWMSHSSSSSAMRSTAKPLPMPPRSRRMPSARASTVKSSKSSSRPRSPVPIEMSNAPPVRSNMWRAISRHSRVVGFTRVLRPAVSSLMRAMSLLAMNRLICSSSRSTRSNAAWAA
jgi:putative methionine-R-sulfoxide reductase with GAF domain